VPSRYVIYVSPYEWGIIEPLKIVADYIRSRLGGGVVEVSDHHIARIFPVLEDFVQSIELKSTAIAKIMDVFEKHFGFTSNEERERVCEAIGRLIDKLSAIRAKEPVRVYKLVKSLRVLLIGFVRGKLAIPISVYEKQS